MSGIAGSVGLRRTALIDRCHVEQSARALQPWRSSPVVTRVEPEAAFAHVNGATEPTSSAKLGSGLLVVADARLDNRGELARVLETHEGCDAALIGEAYRRWGTYCVHRILGDFAFAVWDPTCKRLVCARDPMGTRPFYQVYTADFFAFASAIRGLLALPATSRRLREQAIGERLVNGTLQGTYLDGIEPLPPGHVAVMDRQEVRYSAYWSFETRAPTVSMNAADWPDATAQLMARGLRDRIDTSEDIGCELSGGLDSTAVTCLAAEQGSRSDQTVHALTVVPAGCVERRRVLDAVEHTRRKHHNVEHHLVETPRDRTPLSDLTEEFDFAVAVPAPPHFLFRELLEVACRSGVRTLLTGYGGEAGVSAYARASLPTLMRNRQWAEAARSAPCAAYGWGWHLQRYGPGETLKRAGRRAYYHATGSVPDFTAEAGKRFLAPGFRQQFERASEGRAPMDGQQRLAGVAMGNFPRLVDRARTRGITAEAPLADRRLLELAASAPVRAKLRGLSDRRLLRDAMKGTMPEPLRWRRGQDSTYRLVHARVHSHRDTFLQRTRDLEHKSHVRDYLDMQAVRQVVGTWESSPSSARRAAEQNQALWALMMAEFLCWL